MSKIPKTTRAAKTKAPPNTKPAARAPTGSRPATEPQRVITALKSLKDLPASQDCRVPYGWYLRPAGIGTKPMAYSIPAPVLIVSRMWEIDTQRQFVRLAWHRDGHWFERIVDRQTIATGRAIVELSTFGLPVTSNNASDLVEFLSDYETANLKHLPIELVSPRLGFVEVAGETVFLWGPRVYFRRPHRHEPEGSSAVPGRR